MNKKSAAVMNWRNRKKLQLVEYKGGKCVCCGYSKPIPSCYDFHHLDPKQKEFSISGKSWSFEKLKKEVDKCILLCRNCHSELHWEQSQEARKKRIDFLPCRLKIENKTCSICKNNFKPKVSDQKFCSSICSHKSTRKIERPSKEKLAEEISNNSWVMLGKKYGVSDKAVRKWAISYGLID